MEPSDDKSDDEDDTDKLMRLHRIREKPFRIAKPHWGCNSGCCTLTRDAPTTKGKNTIGMNQNGMMNVEERKKDQYEEVTVDAIMDSGARDSTTSLDIIGGNEIRQTRASKKGVNYYGPDGSSIKNWGEADQRQVRRRDFPQFRSSDR